MNQPNLSSFIWSVADLLRGNYKQSEYGKVILPFTVLRRLDCVLDGTKEAVLKEFEKRSAAGVTPEPFLLRKSGLLFYNTTLLDMKKLMGDQDHIKENLFAYVQGFSPSVKDIFECFDFYTQVDRLAKAGLLYLVSEKFANIDLHPNVVSNTQMGTVFEELIRKFAELSNETAGNIVFATKGTLKGKPQPDANLRDTENVPLNEKVETYFKREVLPHAPEAWIDHEKTKVGYEIPFNRHFYVFKPPRELAEIDAELKGVTDRILKMIGGLSK
jgi:hypothetical protein